MSRYYQIEVELLGDTPMDEAQTREAVEILQDKFNVEIEVWNVYGAGTSVQGWGTIFPGHKTLSGGVSPQGAHERLINLFPHFKVVSRWLCLDNQDWDDVFGED